MNEVNEIMPTRGLEYLYKVQSHPMADYSAGKDQAGRQILIGLRYPFVITVLFDAKGNFLEVRIRLLLTKAPSKHSAGPHIIEDPEFRLTLGKQISLWQGELLFEEQIICIKRFEVKELNLGIEDLPAHFRQFIDEPSQFTNEDRQEYPQMIRDWMGDGNFILWWGTDYYIESSGEII